MPLLPASDYQAPLLLRSAHLQTVLPTLTRRPSLPIPPEPERLELPDGDFLDLVHLHGGATRCLLLFHGLESSAQAPYMRGMAAAALAAGWDVTAVNFRGCSGVPNRLLRRYHSGASEDVHAVVQALLARGRHAQLAAVGFSLGGNVLLNYLGDGRHPLPACLSAAAAIAVPMDLAGCAARTDRLANRYYRHRFLSLMRSRICLKRTHFPDALPYIRIAAARSFRDFDDAYTAPAHGFADAPDYWLRCSALRVLSDIRTPTLILNAQDDPLLTPDCFPVAVCSAHPTLHLEMPPHGGHLGFMHLPPRPVYWHESRVLWFLSEYQ